MNDILRERLKTVPNRPGCYLMRDRRGVIIYIGKAKNLRRRVLSYFRPGAKHAPKVRSMVNTVADLEFMTVRNDAEALLTEANLIKRYKPQFNILMRDDKRYLALRADPEEPFPAFRTCRIVRDDGALYFGPFPSAPVVRAAKDFVEKRWGLRGCKVLVPDEEAYTEEWRKALGTLQKKEKVVQFGMNLPTGETVGSFEQLGFSVLQALGIRSDELER